MNVVIITDNYQLQLPQHCLEIVFNTAWNTGTRRVVLTFPHFKTEMGKQVSTYHQGSAVHNDSRSAFLLFLQGTDSEKAVSRSVLLSTYMMLERFGDNLTVTTSDISKLTYFPPEYYVCTRRKNCSNLCYPTEGWTEVLAQKSKDGHVLYLLFSSEYIISYYIDFPHNPF